MATINSKYNIGDKVWFVKFYEVEKVCEHCGSKYKTSQLIACEGEIVSIGTYAWAGNRLLYSIRYNSPIPKTTLFGDLSSTRSDYIAEDNVYSTKEEAEKAVGDREGAVNESIS